jgi:membrane glycosyltransferase
MATITRELEKRILNYMWFLGIIPVCSLKLALEVLGKLSSSLKNSFANYFDIVIVNLRSRLLKDNDLLVSHRWPSLNEQIMPLLLNDECGGINSSPPINRSSMIPKGFMVSFSNLFDLPTSEALWEEIAKRRRILLAVLVITSTFVATFFMNRILNFIGMTFFRLFNDIYLCDTFCLAVHWFLDGSGRVYNNAQRF